LARRRNAGIHRLVNHSARWALACLPALLAPALALAAPAAATLDDPSFLPENPFAVAGSTVGAPSEIDGYDCAPGVDESGGERVFAIEVPAAGKLTAWVEGDDGVVDVDVHLVVGASLDAGLLSGCVARGNTIAEADVPAGVALVVVDSFEGTAQEGAFILRAAWIGDAWTESEPYEGVVWRAKRYADFAGGPQVVHELLVDPTNPAVTIEALRSQGCETVGEIADRTGAVAAINGGYFTGGCVPVSLLRHDGELLGANSVARSAFGLTSDAEPRIDLVPVAADWPDVEEAHGGGPRLVTASSAHVDDADYAEEGIASPSFIGPNPRTFAGIAMDGRVAFVGVDGRRPTAAGMSLPALANWSVDLGLVDAVNLDGGGSTTVFVRGATPNGVVNYPSDAGEVVLATHEGSRGVSGGFFVFAPPKARAPVFTSTPVTTTAVGATYDYDADAYDANPADTVTYSLVDPPSGASIDEATGVVTWQVPSEAPLQVELVVRASDGALATDQATTLTVRGGVGPGGSGGGGPAGGAGPGVGGGGAGAADAGGGGAGADGSDDGCSCTTPQRGAPGSSTGIGLASLLLGLLSRRRHPG
jgi:MYXO-CTERM domain-containing protein